MCTRPAWWNHKERKSHLLFGKKFTECESRYTVIKKKAMFCTSVGRKKITTLYVVSYYMDNFKGGSLRYICEKPYLSSQIARR